MILKNKFVFISHFINILLTYYTLYQGFSTFLYSRTPISLIVPKLYPLKYNKNVCLSSYFSRIQQYCSGFFCNVESNSITYPLCRVFQLFVTEAVFAPNLLISIRIWRTPCELLGYPRLRIAALLVVNF